MKKLLIFFPLVLILIACTNQQTIQVDSESPAQKVIGVYFEAWNRQDYSTMYSLISDGFKKIEPNAKTQQDFELFAKKQGVTKIIINSIKEKSNDGSKATIYYDIIFVIKENSIPYKGTFTVKYKPDDQFVGWKLIHPYGENIDTS